VARTATFIASMGKHTSALPGASPLEVIVAIHPVTTEPLGLAVVQSADAVILCLELGRTRIDEANVAIDLIGRDRIAGCVLVG
jgi:hypothetical protein